MPRVLIVEDNPVVSEVVQHTLAEAGYAVHAVTDGPSALAAAREEEPAAVVLDLKMPGMDGRFAKSADLEPLLQAIGRSVR